MNHELLLIFGLYIPSALIWVKERSSSLHITRDYRWIPKVTFISGTNFGIAFSESRCSLTVRKRAFYITLSSRLSLFYGRVCIRYENSIPNRLSLFSCRFTILDIIQPWKHVRCELSSSLPFVCLFVRASPWVSLTQMSCSGWEKMECRRKVLFCGGFFFHRSRLGRFMREE